MGKNIRAVKVRGRKLPNYFNRKQLLELFLAIRETDVFMGCLMALFCGLRIGELCKLRKEDIDLEGRKLKVIQGKGRKDRYVPIPDKFIPLIRLWYKVNDDSEYFLPAMHRGGISTQYLAIKFRKVLADAGLSIPTKKSVTGQPRYAYSFHTLRHTYATYLADKGVSIHYIQRALGHSDLHTTLIYAYVAQQDLQNKINMAYGSSKLKKQSQKITDPLQVLQLRLVSGEITPDEYQELLDHLHQGSSLA